MDGYLIPRTAADAIVVRKNKQTNANEILMITRKKEPFKGRFAFPGGHIDYGEDPKDACLRELREECGIEGSEPELIDVRGNPLRDPRYHMISMFYLVKAPDNYEVTAGDDAETANWYNLNELASKKEMLAFDHHDVIVEKLLRRKEFQKP